MSTRRTTRLFWPVFSAFGDLLAFIGANILAYLLRFSESFSFIFPQPAWIPPFEYYLALALASGTFWTLFMAFSGVYAERWREDLFPEIWNGTRTFAFGFALFFAMIFFYRGFLYSRIVALLTFVLAITLIVLFRIIQFFLRRRLFPSRPMHRALAVGMNTDIIESRLQKVPQTGLILNGRLEDPGDISLATAVRKRIHENEIDTVIFVYGFNRFDRVREIVDSLEGQHLNFLLAPDPLGLVTGRLRPLNIAGIPLLRLKEDPLSGWNGVIKRAFDILVSSLILVVISPLLLLLALLVKISSRGPVLYRQSRVGLDGRPFPILKFRSMGVDAEKETGPVWAEKADPRVTPIGHFLRRWSLDELPQFWNVLRGDMSLVGPRPEREHFVERFRAEIPRYIERHRVRAGLTGWAQVNGLRGQAPIDERTRYDLFYVENWSLGFDIKIILITLAAVIRGRDAY